MKTIAEVKSLKDLISSISNYSECVTVKVDDVWVYDYQVVNISVNDGEDSHSNYRIHRNLYFTNNNYTHRDYFASISSNHNMGVYDRKSKFKVYYTEKSFNDAVKRIYKKNKSNKSFSVSFGL